MYTQMTSCSCFSSLKGFWKGGRERTKRMNVTRKCAQFIRSWEPYMIPTAISYRVKKCAVAQLVNWFSILNKRGRSAAPKISNSNTTKIRENPTQVQQTISSEVIFQSQFKPTWKEGAQHQFQRYLKCPFPSFQTAPRLQDYKGPDKKNTDTKNKFIQIQIQMLNIGKPNFTFQKTDSKNKTKAGFQTKNTSQKKY